MHTDASAAALQGPSFTEPSCVLFNPTGDRAWLKNSFDNVPRYLFRVSTPKSDGTTDKVWVKSKDCKNCHRTGKDDILASGDNKLVAGMLNRHLRWSGTPSDLDSLVFWTSSLLFALQYIFYRHHRESDSSRLDTIYLCVIDTLGFPKGVFLRDMDIISAYGKFDTELKDLEKLRKKKHQVFKGSYYFGEYLSQGALKVDGKCQLVSAQAIVDGGLFDVQPGFRQSMFSHEPKWANRVIELREPFYQNDTQPQMARKHELEAAIKIAQLFGPRWRLPMAANLVGLLPRGSEDWEILLAFVRSPFTGLTASILPGIE